MTNGSQTVTRNVTITADYSLTMAYFTATITVTYPAGSTCTCANGSTVLTAPDTSGNYTFIVTNAGTWTVSCTDGDKTKSASVSITINGQTESVTLTYELYLFSETDGNLGNWSGEIDIHDGYMQTRDGNYMQSYCDLVDLTNYKTLYIDYQSEGGGGGSRTWVAPSTGTTINEGTGVQLTVTNTRKTKSLDITAYNGNYRIVINAWYYQWKIYNIWLEPN